MRGALGAAGSWAEAGSVLLPASLRKIVQVRFICWSQEDVKSFLKELLLDLPGQWLMLGG